MTDPSLPSSPLPDAREALTEAILKTRWPDGGRVEHVSTVTATMIADAVLAAGFTLPRPTPDVDVVEREIRERVAREIEAVAGNTLYAVNSRRSPFAQQKRDGIRTGLMRASRIARGPAAVAVLEGGQ